MMKANKIEKSELDALLSHEYTSEAGLVFSPGESIWRLTTTSGSGINVARALKAFPIEVQPYYRLALARYAGNVKADTVRNILSSLIAALDRHGDDLNILDERDFLSAKVRAGERREYQISVIRGFLRFWHKSGLYGVSDEFIDAIGRLSFRANEKGRAVLSNDPWEGPYTQLEMEAIIDGINNAFLESRITLGQWVLVKLYAERGLRRAQVAQLAFGDFLKGRGGFIIDQPRGKQRKRGFREVFSRYAVSEDLYNAVQRLKDQRVKEIDELASHSVADSLNLLPLFPRHEILVDRFLKGAPIDASCFQNREYLSGLIVHTQSELNAFSERTGDLIHLASSRFRLTLGTDLNREGAGVGVIAAALDHADHQNAGVYVQSTGDNATRLNHKIGKLLAPLAQAFAGLIVRDESEAERGGDRSSRIRTMDGTDNVGSCGNHAFCSANAPVACYTCVKFQPWLDGPHEDVLNDLYDERERTVSVTGDETIARILDRTILAVEDVVQRCKAILSKESSDE